MACSCNCSYDVFVHCPIFVCDMIGFFGLISVGGSRSYNIKSEMKVTKRKEK